MFKSVVKPNNNFVFSHYEQVFRTRKVLMFIGLFPLVLLGTTTSQNIRYFFNTLYIPSSEYYAKGRSFTANSDNKGAVCPKVDRSSTANSGTKIAVLLGMNRCVSFSLFSARTRTRTRTHTHIYIYIHETNWNFLRGSDFFFS